MNLKNHYFITKNDFKMLQQRNTTPTTPTTPRRSLQVTSTILGQGWIHHPGVQQRGGLLLQRKVQGSEHCELMV